MKSLSIIIIISTALFAGGLSAQTGVYLVNSSGDTLVQVREDGQVIIGGAVASGNAILDMDALYNNKGIMIPRLSTTQRIAMTGLSAADDGLLVYEETSGSFWYWNGSQWNALGTGTGDNLGNGMATQNLNLNGNALSGDGDNEGIFIDANGQVGIGEMTPSSALDVAGNIILANDDPEMIFFEDGGGNGTRQSAIRNVLSPGTGTNPEDQRMIFRVSDSGDTSMNNVMTLVGNRNIGIGTTTPSARLHVVATADNATLVKLQNNATYEGRVLYVNSIANGTADILDVQNGSLVVQGNGNVGIGTTSPANELSVAGVATFTGKVGIGTVNPGAPLYIFSSETVGSFSGANNGGAWMYQASGAGSDEIGYAQDAGNTGVSIFATGSIVSEGEGVFVAADVNWSDARIKRIDGVSDAKQDLELLDSIEITDYRRIDGGKPEKKVIAQQVQRVFPQAVSLQPGVIPSIYAHIGNFDFDKERQLLTVETPMPHNLVVGDLIDYYTETGKYRRQAVTAILSEKRFQVSATAGPQELFIFGKWVPDVHMVDYEAISMLNVSATQELHRIVKAHDQRLVTLEAKDDRLASRNAALEQRLARVEQTLYD